jgi:hypothetical protein
MVPTHKRFDAPALMSVMAASCYSDHNAHERLAVGALLRVVVVPRVSARVLAPYAFS